MTRFIWVMFFAGGLLCAPLFSQADSIDKVFNYPNPYQRSAGTTTITFFYTNNSGADFTLTCYLYIYDIAGHRVKVQKLTAPITTTNPNRIEVPWNGHNDKGRLVAPGIYFVRIITERGVDGSGNTSLQSISAYGKMLLK